MSRPTVFNEEFTTEQWLDYVKNRPPGGVNFDRFCKMTCLACGYTFGKHGYNGCTQPARPGYPKDTNTLPAWMLEDKP